MAKWLSRLAHQTKLTFVALAALGTVVLLWFLWGIWGVAEFAKHWKTGAHPIAELGQIGDIFGGVNALFAALAFVGVAFAAYFQNAQLSDVRRQTRLAEEGHIKQSFEPLFFQLLSVYRDLAENLHLIYPHPLHQQQTVGPLPVVCDHIRSEMALRWGIYIQTDDVGFVSQPYEDTYTTNEEKLGPYFRTMYHLFRLIDESGLPESDRYRFSRIARGMLGKDTLFLLTLNCLTDRGERFKGLVEKYSLLKHINKSNTHPTFEQVLAQNFFSPTATMSSEERKAIVIG
jgi:hypothetical protein